MYSGMLVTDLDGTLNHPSGEFTAANRQALHALERARCLRVIATGRSLFHVRKYVPLDFPVDYIVFSSGAGIIEWPSQRVVVQHHLPAEAVRAIRAVLVELRHDFMIHDPIPENHRFAFWDSGMENADFRLRCERQKVHGRALTDEMGIDLATQFLVVAPPEAAESAHRNLRARLPGYSVIRATSPLDKKSAWLEIFAAQVSKSQAAAWLAERHALTAAHALAVGNDYNDFDLLHWAGTARVVADSPPELRAAFTAVAPHDQSGFAEAVTAWLAARAG